MDCSPLIAAWQTSMLHGSLPCAPAPAQGVTWTRAAEAWTLPALGHQTVTLNLKPCLLNPKSGLGLQVSTGCVDTVSTSPSTLNP